MIIKEEFDRSIELNKTLNLKYLIDLEPKMEKIKEEEDDVNLSEEEEEEEEDDDNLDDVPELIEIDEYVLIILIVKETKKHFVMMNNKELLNVSELKEDEKATKLGKRIENKIDLYFIEKEITEIEFKEIKENDKFVLYDYNTFDKVLDNIDNVIAECCWRRYKHASFEYDYIKLV